jgi:hypothetical protein
MATADNRTARSLALALHTDLQNLDTYAGNPALTAGLLATAEEKLAIIAEYLATVRREAGLRPSLVIAGECAA